jgi:imidazolonepropionase-like amidohydrolase
MTDVRATGVRVMRPAARLIRTALVAGLAAGLAANLGAHQRGGRGPGPLAVRDVTLIDGTGSAARPHVSIVVRNGRVDAIVPAGQEPAGVTTVDGTGRYAIPGLFDAHVHVTTGTTHEHAVDELSHALAGGVTTAFELAGDTRMAGELAREALTHEIQAPSFYYVALMAGPAFFSDPRVLAISRGFQPGEAPWAQSVTDATDPVRAVAEAKGTGAIGIKLYAAMDAEAVRHITQEAKRQGLRVIAHATVFPAKPSDLVAAGVDMLAHSAYLVWEGSPASTDFAKRASGDFAHVPPDSPAIARVLAAMRDRGTALNPTLWIFADDMPQDDVSRLRTPWMDAVTKRAAAMGVPIVAGTDDMYDPGKDPLPLIHRELEQLVSGAGMTPLAALLAATRNAARVMGIDADRGTIEPGKAADILLLDANPLDDIRNTRRIHTVIKDGRVVPVPAAGS